MFKINSLFIYLLFLSVFFVGCNTKSGKPRILLFTKTAGFYHSSIPSGIAAIKKLGKENGFEVDTTTDAAMFTEDTLKKYAAVIFFNSTGDILNNYQEADFERYIQAGGGYVGVHAAADAEYDWGWYGRLVGAYFKGHPLIQKAVLNVNDKDNAATKNLPAQWARTDEWYNFKKLNKDVHVLLKIDETTYQGGENGKDHPMAWYHEYDGGRAFYTELGHTEESYSDTLYLQHLLGGIKYAIGDNTKLNYAKAKTLRTPDEDRFVKDQLSQGEFFEPTEMSILPNLDILIVQRRGEVMFYNHETKKVSQAGSIKVYFKSANGGGNTEEGLLGLAIDPDYKKNNYIYMYYAPVDTAVDRLSRFKFVNNHLDSSSEKVILEVATQRDICCHTGGSIAFGANNILFVSAGDNSTPFDQPNSTYQNHGFSPQDNRPGFEQYDARRSAGNTNDLRGKIIRIKINDDGSYEIPQGNLFPPGEAKTRPEIYVMGDRNPYRITVDKKTGFLYWGEVGPDSNVDSLDTRGPRGYDEMNQAKKAGNFGWPYFVGNNYPYHQYDYTTGKIGPAYDPEKPVNNSPNNTGLNILPPAQPAFIWYPYAASPDFPSVGTGGRTALAGPVYYMNDYPKETRYPEYYNNKLFVSDWIRGWIKVVTMLPNGDFDKMEPFMEHAKFNSAIDIEMGPDGNIYLLEYGGGWFAKNPDAGLARLRYISGNRPPKVNALTVDRKNGNLPFTINASADVKDPENNKLTYVWHIGSITKQTDEPKLNYTLTKPGDYNISVTVTDDKKSSAESNIIPVFAGNTQPEVNITITGNKTFYFPGKKINYLVAVKDAGEAVIDTNLTVSNDYVTGNEQSSTSFGHMQMSNVMIGKTLITNSDCKTCHKIDERSIGPAFTQVAQKYHGDMFAFGFLVQKIIKGGSGVWGEVQMPAHPGLSQDDAGKIVSYVMSLSDTKIIKKLPSQGTLLPEVRRIKNQSTHFVLTATYADNGGGAGKPLSSSAEVNLISNIVDAAVLTGNPFAKKDSAGIKYFVLPDSVGFLKAEDVDLTGIKAIELSGIDAGKAVNYNIEIRLGNTNGKIIGRGEIKFSGTNKSANTIVPLQKGIAGNQTLYIIFKTSFKPEKAPLLKTLKFLPD